MSASDAKADVAAWCAGAATGKPSMSAYDSKRS
jgi:hypothetical protein